MSLSLHLFKKDLRHTRPLLAVWLLLVLLQGLLVGAAGHPGDRVRQGIYLGLSLLVPVLEFLVAVVLIPLFIIEDPLVGTTAFWYSRPISRPALLEAKALYAVLLLALPTAVQLIVLGANHVTPGDLALALPQLVLTQLGHILTIIAIASICPSFGRYAATLVALFIGLALISAGLTAGRLLLNPDQLVASAEHLSLARSRGLASAIVIALGTGGLVVHQYLTRRTGRTIAGLAVVIVAMLAALNFWPWDLLSPSTPAAAKLDFDPARVAVAIGPSRGSNESVSLRGGAAKGPNLALPITGLPPAYFATARVKGVELRQADGTDLAAKPAPGELTLQSETPALEAALLGTPVINPLAGAEYTPNPFSLGAAAYDREGKQPLALTLNLTLTLHRYRVTAELPLTRGAAHVRGSEREEITDVLRKDDGVDVILRRQSINLEFDRNAPPPLEIAEVSGYGRVVYLLWNKQRGEALGKKRPSSVDVLSAMSTGLQAIHMLRHDYLQLSFGPETGNMMMRVPTLDDAWLSGAELVRLEEETVATVQRQASKSQFELNGTGLVSRPASTGPIQPTATPWPKIELPPHPGRDQIGRYIGTVLMEDQRHLRTGAEDPGVVLLVAVGPENLDLLIAADQGLPFNQSASLAVAANRLAGEKDKSLILASLAAHPALVASVTRFGWQDEARPTLLALLDDPAQTGLPADWIRAVASFRDPATYPALQAYLVRTTSKQATYNAIRTLPGLDLTAAVDAAWRRGKFGLTPRVLDAALVAGRFGHRDALDAAVDVLRDPEALDAFQREAMNVIRRLTPARGDRDELLAWYDQNRNQLAFDPRRRQFVPISPPRK